VVSSTAGKKAEAVRWWKEFKVLDGWPAGDHKMSTMNIDEATVGFLDFLMCQKGKSAGRALAIQSAAATHISLSGFESPSKLPMTMIARRSLAKQVPAAVAVAAFGADVFRRLLAGESSAAEEDSKYMAACYVLGYHGLLRVSEMTIPSKAQEPRWLSGRGLMNEDLKQVRGPRGRKGMEITLKWRKNAQRGELLRITLWERKQAGDLDPFQILVKIHRPDRPRAMLLREKGVRVGWRPMTAARVRKRIKAALAALGENPKIHSSHSLRASGATALIATGKWSTEMVMQYGGWNSRAAERYFRAAMNRGRDAVGDVWEMFEKATEVAE
jgi:hypothetical protein